MEYHYLYKVYDEFDELIYVGETRTFESRFMTHKSKSTWWLDVARIELERYSSRDDALAEESRIITNERPKHNGRGNPDKWTVVGESQINRDIGLLIRNKRNDAGLTAVELARLIGVTQPQVSVIERGVSGTTMDRLYIIAKALQCNVSDLLPIYMNDINSSSDGE